MRVMLSVDEELWLRFRIACLKRKITASAEVSRCLHQQLVAWAATDDDQGDTRQLDLFLRQHAEERS
jgi:hypothetical protein